MLRAIFIGSCVIMLVLSSKLNAEAKPAELQAWQKPSKEIKLTKGIPSFPNGIGYTTSPLFDQNALSLPFLYQVTNMRLQKEIKDGKVKAGTFSTLSDNFKLCAQAFGLVAVVSYLELSEGTAASDANTALIQDEIKKIHQEWNVQSNMMVCIDNGGAEAYQIGFQQAESSDAAGMMALWSGAVLDEILYEIPPHIPFYLGTRNNGYKMGYKAFYDKIVKARKPNDIWVFTYNTGEIGVSALTSLTWCLFEGVMKNEKIDDALRMKVIEQLLNNLFNSTVKPLVKDEIYRGIFRSASFMKKWKETKLAEYWKANALAKRSNDHYPELKYFQILQYQLHPMYKKLRSKDEKKALKNQIKDMLKNAKAENRDKFASLTAYCQVWAKEQSLWLNVKMNKSQAKKLAADYGKVAEQFDGLAGGIQAAKRSEFMQHGIP